MMAQIIDVNIPANMKPTVCDAMQYVVNRSGYSLCGPNQGHVQHPLHPAAAGGPVQARPHEPALHPAGAGWTGLADEGR